MREIVRVNFLALHLHGQRLARKAVEVAFAERLIAVWQDDGPTSHAAIVSIDRFFEVFSSFLVEPDEVWLRPLLLRLQAGDEPIALQTAAIAAYRMTHGVEPEVKAWQVTRDELVANSQRRRGAQ
ncbi:MAG: hypothetical protein GX862_10695 [Leucobacter sp.]|nr:hypothetical protein [Leucobacter sp.]